MQPLAARGARLSESNREVGARSCKVALTVTPKRALGSAPSTLRGTVRTSGSRLGTRQPDSHPRADPEMNQNWNPPETHP